MGALMVKQGKRGIARKVGLAAGAGAAAALGYFVYSARAYIFTTPGNVTAPYTPRGIDRVRLEREGVSPEVIESLDERDGGNITPTGEVLFLDENRLKIREKPQRPMRKNHANGLGVKNKIVEKTSAMITGSDGGGEAFAALTENMGEPIGSPMRRFTSEFLGFEDSGYTHVSVLPLNVDVAEGHHNVVMPVDLIVQELKEAHHIAIMDYCICRKNFDCKDHPHDFGCIFLNANAVHAIEAGNAHEATVDEAIEHVLKAAEMGLMGAADFVEGEQYIWNMKNDEMHEYRMFCFCCECCCLAMKVLKNSTKDISMRCAPVGWTATVNHDACVGCGACASKCPQHCIEYREDGKCVIDQDKCVGCGFCKLACENDAVRIRQTMPMRANLNEYYLAEGRIDDRREHAPAVPTGLLR